MTKITDIKSFIVWEGHRNLFILKVEADDGSYGWGESGLSGRELAVQGMVRHFREWLIGRDSRNIGALWQEMYRGQYFEGGRVITAAISAIDIALHDLNARRLGVPVYQILGGKHRDFIPCFVTSTISPGEGIVEDVQRLINNGWKTIRTGIGHPKDPDPLIFEPRESIAVTSLWLDKLRLAVGREPTIGIDYHHRLSVAEAASFCNSMPRGTLDFIEEPIRDESPEAYEALRTMTDIPFAIGEEMSSKWQYLPYIERGLTQFARIDICNIGGFTEAMKVAGWCETHYIDLMPHNPLGPVSTAACIQLGAATANFAWLEERSPEPGFRFNPELFINQPKLEGVSHIVKDEHGLGIDINEEIAEAQTFEFWEAPHFRRRDGSHTNW